MEDIKVAAVSVFILRHGFKYHLHL